MSAAIEGMFLNTELFGHQRGASNKGYKKIKYGTMVLSTQNLHLGNANVNQRFEHGMVSPAYKTYDITGCSVELIAQWIKSAAAKRFFYNATTVGASVCRRNVEWDTLYEQPLYLPGIDEQDKIAKFLSLISERINKQQQFIVSLKKYKRGLLNQIFSAISKGSQRRKLRELVHVSGGKTPSMSNSLYWNGDIVWISSKDMKSSRISGSELKITNLALNEMTLYHPGTLLLVARSGILKHSLPLAILEVDATINQDIKALQVHGCNAFYLYYAILSQEDNIIRTLVKTGTTVQSLMMDSFLNIEIPTPDIDLQQSIIDKLAKLEKYVDVQEEELSLLSQMRNGLLQQLFI
ncbi:restriction endonuclease subunit S [Dysosmobacter welbionis]